MDILMMMMTLIMNIPAMTNKKAKGYLAFFHNRKRKSKIKQKLYLQFLEAQKNKDINKAGILAQRILEL